MITRVSTRIASTHPVEKNPGLAFLSPHPRLLADRSNSGGIPLLFNYEIGDPVPMSNVDAVVVATDDAESALDAERWAAS